MPKSALIPAKAVFKVKKAYIQWKSQYKMLPKKRNLSEDIAKLLFSKRAEEASGHIRDGNIAKL